MNLENLKWPLCCFRRGLWCRCLPQGPPERGPGDGGEADAAGGDRHAAHHRRHHIPVPRKDGRRRGHDQQTNVCSIRDRR